MGNLGSDKLYGTSLIKAKHIMDFLLEADTAPTLSTLSESLDVSKPTVLKILNTLVALGLVRRDDESKRYYLGTQMIRYGQKALVDFSIGPVARRSLERLRDETNETVSLAIVRDDKIVLIDKLESSASVRLQSFIGGTMNMYSSAMGKAVLATYSKAQLDKYLKNHSLKPLTEKTIVDQEKLRENLARVRDLGVAIDNEENEPEVLCLGATLKKGNHLFGAISISTPKYRLPEQRQRDFTELLLKTQEEIEQLL